MSRAGLAGLLLLGACEIRSLEVRQVPGGLGGETGGAGGFGVGGSGPSGGTAGWNPGVGGAGTGGAGGATGGSGGQGGAVSCPMSRDEVCNGLDDDCNGAVDEGFDLQNDPGNCGRCGQGCSYVHAFPACSAGQCALGTCFDGYADADEIAGNGCECLFTNGQVEICDGADNDCDGDVDEDFDFAADKRHCGGCFRACGYAQADSACEDGLCSMGACEAGFLDLDRDAKDGCEYRCTATAGGIEICDGQDNDCDGTIDGNTTDGGQLCAGTPGGTGECRQGTEVCVNGTLVCLGAGIPGVEVCDGKDNDCDGSTDEEDPFLDTSCYRVGAAGCDVTAGTCVGPCRLGRWACSSSRLVCQGMVTPINEVCDGADNDCDGGSDEGFDKESDPRFCGGCNIRCEYPNAIAVCDMGSCALEDCVEGFADANGNSGDGCEYQCSNQGVEVCDGRDNDCDGQTDAEDDDLQYPASNFCSQRGECGKGPGGPSRYGDAASYPVCTTPPGVARADWICNYPATVETLAGSPNQIVTQESVCDGKDNDCDSAIDEHTSDQPGSSCEESIGLGECRRRGVYRCQANARADTACDFSGVPVRTAVSEICDGKDNDCDGMVDESWDNPDLPAFARCGGVSCLGVRDQVNLVDSSYVFRYEASRVDATADEQGVSSTRPCSRGAVLPWNLVNQSQAQTACQKIGMRLCTASEWTSACRGNQTCVSEYFPYACSFNAYLCNGAEQEREAPVAVGSEAMCTQGGAGPFHDLSGNVAEWTSQQNGTIGGKKIFILRGGSFNNYEPALRCDSTLLAFAEDYSFPDAGFRCCSICAPGQAECLGACVNLASSNSDCGACGEVCLGGTSCSNGRCQ